MISSSNNSPLNPAPKNKIPTRSQKLSLQLTSYRWVNDLNYGRSEELQTSLNDAQVQLKTPADDQLGKKSIRSAAETQFIICN